MTTEAARLDAQGRIVIPASVRHALGLKPGDSVALRVVDGEVRMTSREAGIERARAAVAALNLGRRSLVDELIDERRAEAARE